MRRHCSYLILASVMLFTGCAAMNPQGAARQQSETYYGRPYEQLSPEEKMRLEDHLAKQSNTSWRTNGQVAAGLGRLLQGVGVLVLSTR